MKKIVIGLDFQLTQTDIGPFVILHFEHKNGAWTSPPLVICRMAFLRGIIFEDINRLYYEPGLIMFVIECNKGWD